MPESSTTSQIENICGRVVLRCRRGTRELDLILARFINDHYRDLSPGERCQFDQLLNQQDPVLTTWLFGQAQPGDNDLARLVHRIRHTFKH